MPILTTTQTVGVFAGDPNGLVSGAVGSLLRDSTNGKLWINITGSTVWINLLRSDQITATPFWFGTGSDGNQHMDGVATVLGMVPVSGIYTGVRPYQFGNLTIDNTVLFRPAGWPYFVNGDLAGQGVITTSGFGGSLGTQGAAAYAASRPLPNGAAGGIAGVLAPGNSARAIRVAVAGSAAGGSGSTPGTAGGLFQGGGGGGGAGGNGGAGGSITLASASNGDFETYDVLTSGFYRGPADSPGLNSFTLGTGGGGGGINGVDSAGGGGSGGWHVGFVRRFTGTVSISSRGGSGAAGQVSGGGFAGGGGGGGAGGLVALVCGPGATPTPDIVGGNGGAASGGIGTASAGGKGGDGIYRIIQ